jgi:hypothetical protein
MATLTPIQHAALMHVACRPIDRITGRMQSVDLDDISEPMRQRLIDLAMMEPPLVDVDGPLVYATDAGIKAVKNRHEQDDRND